MSTQPQHPAQNTDRELWREPPIGSTLRKAIDAALNPPKAQEGTKP